MARTSSIELEPAPQKYRKEWIPARLASCPTGRVAPLGSIWADTVPRRKQNPAHSGRPVQQDAWHLMAVSSSQEQDDCATKREPCHSGEPSQMGWSQQWGDLQVKINSAFPSTFLRRWGQRIVTYRKKTLEGLKIFTCYLEPSVCWNICC